MKQLLFILSLFLALSVCAQKYPADFSTYGVHYPRGNFDSALHVPVLKDTVSVRDDSRYKDSAEIGIFQGELWYKPANGYWKKAGNGSGNGGGGGIFAGNADSLNHQSGSYYLNYNNLNNKPDFTPFATKASVDTAKVNLRNEIAAKGSNSTVTALTSSSSISWDYNSGNIATLTLATNALISISNTNDGDAGYLIVTQDATGGRTLTLPDGTNIAINSGANKTTTLGFVKVGGVFKWTGDYVVTTTGSGAASQTGNVINIPTNTGGGNASMEQATTFSAINTTNTQTRLIEVATDETNGGKTTYYAYNNKVSPNTLERFTTTTISLFRGRRHY
jgi:hypothetical protein